MDALKEIQLSRKDRINIINRLATIEILNEIEHKLEVDRDPDLMEESEEPYDFFSAFEDVYDQMELNGHKDYSRSFVTAMRDIVIAINWCVEVTEEELEHIVVLSGKKYSFKHRNKKYQYVG